MRDTDDVPSLQFKARLAAILGTFQASLVDFPYLRDIWRHNTAEVRTPQSLLPHSLHIPVHTSQHERLFPHSLHRPLHT